MAQRLRDDHGVAASESSVRRWISANLSEEAAREKVTVARGPVPPGSEAQIDYGRLGMWFDPVSGRRVAVWAFVMVLAYSRHHLRPAGPQDAPIVLVRIACGGVRVLRRCPGQAGPGQLEGRRGTAGSV